MCFASRICWDFVIFPLRRDLIPDDFIEASSPEGPSVYTTSFWYYFSSTLSSSSNF